MGQEERKYLLLNETTKSSERSEAIALTETVPRREE
jgi:hypothetical protein